MKGKYITATAAILMLLVLASCGEKKECPASCEDGNPCTADFCGDDTDYECVHNPIPGCTLDCPMPCMGPAGAYMEMMCDPAAKQCASDVKAGLKITTSPLTNEMLSMGNKFKVITTFNTPFNMKKDLFNMKISASQFGTGMSDIKIKKAELMGTDPNRQTITLGEKPINKYIWDLETVVEDDMRISFPTSDPDGQFTNVKLRITYEYRQEFAGQVDTKTASFEITLRGVTLTWMLPGMTYKCPDSCDDNNDGTADVCSEATDFFCEHQPIPGKCGNYVCDPTENKCKCPEDCGPCEGDAGQFLSYICHEGLCKTMIKQGVIQQPNAITDEKNRNFYYLQNKYSFNEPFNVNADKFRIEFKLYTKQEAVGTITIVEAKVLDRTTEVASKPIGTALNAVGSTVTAEIPVTTFVGAEEEKSLSLRVDVEYQYTTAATTELRKDSFIATIGKVTLINPTLP